MEQNYETIYKCLTEDFPPEAIQADKSRSKKNPMTSIKAQYVIDRLNLVFTPFGWKTKGNFHEEEKGVLYVGKLSVKDPISSEWHDHEAVGYAKKEQSSTDGAYEKLLGDVYKSAATDALSKAASKLGIGNSVFKGLVKPPSDDDMKAQKKVTDGQIKRLWAIMKQKNTHVEQVKSYVKDQWLLDDVRNLNMVQYDQVVSAVENGKV